MNRKEKMEFIQNEIMPQITDVKKMIEVDLFRVCKLISRWRIGKPQDVIMQAKVIDGSLFINGEYCGRIHSKENGAIYSDKAYYWEGRILEKQEKMFD